MTDLDRILGFLERIGISAVAMALPRDTFLPAIDIHDGALLFDPARLDTPGDLLHEAGHIAVTDPALRPTLSVVSADPAEEMAAMAWSYAAALAAAVDPATVFHAAGYRGGGESLALAYAAGGGPGVPMLAWYGMTREPGGPPRDAPYFPAVARWLR